MALLEGKKGHFFGVFFVENSDFSQRHAVLGTIPISE